MVLPDYYKRFYTLFIRFALVMIFVGLLAGFAYQESIKKSPFSETLTAGVHFEAIKDLALVHGHIFLQGVLIPLAIVFMLNIGIQLNRQPVSEKTLKVGGWHYIIGASVALILMLYKGYHFLLMARGGETDFAVIDAAFFGGQDILRGIVYALTHIAMTVGLSMLAVGIWSSLGKENTNLTSQSEDKTLTGVL